MIKVKDGYGKLIGSEYKGSADLVLLSDGSNLGYAIPSTRNTLVLRNTSGQIESSLTTDSSLSPFVVTSTVVNTNLNSDLLDGFHAGGLFLTLSSSMSVNLTVKIGNTEKKIEKLYATYDGLGNTIATKYVTLDTALTISGVKTFSSLLKFTVSSVSPFTVDSNIVVTNLNADLLDGTHKADLFTDFSNITSGTDTNKVSITIGGTTKKIIINYAQNAGSIGGITADGLFTDLSSTPAKNLSITIGGTTKDITSLYSNYWVPQAIGSKDFNTMYGDTYRGTSWYGGGSNTATNNPLGSGSAFGMLIWRNADGYTALLIMGSDGRLYVRVYDGSSWSQLLKFAYATDAGLGGGYWANLPVLAVADSTTTPTFGGVTVNGTSLLNGLVGIGILNPKAKLAVNVSALSANPTSGSLGTLNTMSVGAAGSYGTYFWTRGTGKGYIQVGREDGTATTYDLILQLLGGNVGIGTENPIHKLQVAGAGVFNNTGSTTYASNGITIGAGDAAERYITCYGKTGTSYINVGYGPGVNNSGEFFFNYVSNGSTSNYSGVGIYGGANYMYLYPNYTTFRKPLVMPGELYSGNCAINMSNSDIININALYTADNAESGTEGLQFSRENGYYDSVWAASGVLYFSPNGNLNRTGSYSTNYTVLHTGNYGSYLGYIGTTPVQKSAAAQALTGITRISNSANNVLYLGNADNSSWVLTLDICSHSGTSKWAINVNGQAWFSKLMVGIAYNGTGSNYAVNVTGDSHVTGWSRANSGFYVEGTGVHYTHQGTLGEINMINNNEFLWSTSNGSLYFNYRGASRGTTVTNYIWNAGSSSSYASHSMGSLTTRGIITSIPYASASSNLTYTYSGGGYIATTAPNMRLYGDNTYGISTIEFISLKGSTNINSPSDCGFILFLPYGVSTLSTPGYYPTLSTSGEKNRLVIGVNNDADDLLWLLTPGVDGLRHIVGTSNYRVLTSQNTYVTSGTGVINGTTITQVSNSDTVDGYHATGLFRLFGGLSVDFNFTDGNNNNGIYYLHSNYTLSNKNGITYGSLMNFSTDASSWLLISSNSSVLYYRQRWWSGGGGAWSSWKQIAFTSDIPNPANYYWANIRVSASSSTGTLPTFNTCYTSNWFRSTGATGWYNETYLGGIHMLDTTWVRTYNGKSFYCSAVILAGNRIYTGYDSGLANSISCSNWFRSNGTSGWYNPTYECHVYPNNIGSYGGLVLRGTKNSYHGALLGPNTNHMVLMSHDVHHGLYCENTGTWEFYYNRSSGGVGIRTSSITKNFNVSGQSYLSSNVWIGTTSGAEMLNVGGWVGTTGSTGWYNISYAGGIYMEDSTWVRIYNNKKFYVNNSDYSAIHSAGGVYVAGAVHSYANLLKSTCNGYTISIGSQNNGWCHYDTSAPAHWFNKAVHVAGHVYGGTNYNRRLAYVDEITNSWRGVEDSLTSTSTSNSLTANMGRVLANGASDRPIVLLAGTLYRNGASSSYTTWYFTGYRHRSISSSNPSVYISGGVARFYFTLASGYGFSFAQVCANHQASGEATSYQSTEYQTRSSGLFWFGTYTYGLYLYIRAIALGDRNNDTAESYTGMWTNYSDGVTRVSIIAVGYAW